MSISSKMHMAMTAAVLCGLASCERSPVTGPLELLGNDTEFFAPVTLSEMQDNARSSGSLRVEIDVIDGSLVASSVTIQFSEGDDREVIDSRITGVSVDGTAGSMTVALGDLVVSFNGDTKFADGEGNAMIMDAFVTAVQAARADGLTPTVRATRPAPDVLQAPDDGTFLAAEVTLSPTDEDESSLTMNIGLSHLVLNDAPPPDAWIHLLNIMIELHVRDGTTEIEIERPEFEKLRFEGVVESVDLDARSVKLAGGTVIRLIDDTKIRFEHGHDWHLSSLEEVARAIEAGRTVVAHGWGVLEAEEPRTIVAIKIAFLMRPPPMERFHGHVREVNLEKSILVLGEGLVVRVDEHTKIRPPENSADDHHLGSLEAVARALQAGLSVVARGYGIVESDADGARRILARFMVLEIERPPLKGFEGIVASVNLENQTLQIADGPVIQVTKDTKVLATTTDAWRLHDLAAVAAALAEGKTVIVHGRGYVVSEEPVTIEAQVIAFHVQPPDLTEFEGTVESVNPEEGSITLVGGRVILTNDETRFKLRAHYFASADVPVLELVQRALDAGLTVGVSGAGTVEGDAILAVLVVFHFDFVGEIGFEGHVTSADVETQSFKLENGLTIHVVDNITIDVAGDLKSIAEVAEAIAAGTAVRAAGRAVLLVEGELVKAVAAYVKFGI